jgi:hypothetical protein
LELHDITAKNVNLFLAGSLPGKKGPFLMVIVDSSGWLEWFTGGRLADTYQKYLADQGKLLVPTIILYEVYKILKREVGEEKALLADLLGRHRFHHLIPRW